MALSGSTSVAVTKYDTLKFSWERTGYSLEDNTSTIGWKMELIAVNNGAIQATFTKDWFVSVNGTLYSGNNYVGIGNNATKLLASGSTIITHNNNGEKSFSYRFRQFFGISFGGVYIDTIEGSGTGVLDPIPKGAVFVSAPNFTDEQNPTITYSNPIGNSATSLEAGIVLSDTQFITYRPISKTGTSYTFNFTDAERKVLRQAADSTNSLTVYFYLKTVIGETTFQNYSAKTLTIINAEPTISPTIKDTNATTLALTGDSSKMVKGYNTLNYTIAATAKKEATINKRTISYKGGTVEHTAGGTLNNMTDGDFTFTATDSRGNTVSKDIKLTVIDYIKPTCNQELTIAFTDETIAQIGLKITGSYFNGTFGAKNNSLKVEYRYKTNSGSWGSWTAAPATLNNNTYTCDFALNGFSYTNDYTFQCRATDALNTATTTEYLIKLKPVFDWSETDFNFNVPIYVNGNLMDTPIEQGTKDGWYYRKWESGFAECWYSGTATGVDVGEFNLDGMYYSGSKGVNFPFTFTQVYYTSASGGSTGNMNFVRPFNNTTSSMTYIVMGMADKSNVSVRINLEAKGRWK